MTRISEDKRVALIQYLMHVRCSARSLTSFISCETVRLQNVWSLPRRKVQANMYDEPGAEMRCWKRFRIKYKGTDSSDPSEVLEVLARPGHFGVLACWPFQWQGYHLCRTTLPCKAKGSKMNDKQTRISFAGGFTLIDRQIISSNLKGLWRLCLKLMGILAFKTCAFIILQMSSGGTRSHSPKTRRWPQLGRVIPTSFDWAKWGGDFEHSVWAKWPSGPAGKVHQAARGELYWAVLYLLFDWRKLSRISVSIDFLVGKELEASGKLEVLQQDGSCYLEGLKEGQTLTSTFLERSLKELRRSTAAFNCQVRTAGCKSNSMYTALNHV